MMTIVEALADPTRRIILDLPREQPRLVGELPEFLRISQPGVSKHLHVLRKTGLVCVRQDAQRHWYQLCPDPLAEIDTGLGSSRHLWQERFDRLDHLLTDLQEQERETKRDENQVNR